MNEYVRFSSCFENPVCGFQWNDKRGLRNVGTLLDGRVFCNANNTKDLYSLSAAHPKISAGPAQDDLQDGYYGTGMPRRLPLGTQG